MNKRELAIQATIIATGIVIFLITAAEGALIDVCNSAVRVSTQIDARSKSYGSGGIIGSDEDSYLVVTCEHVANKDTATIEVVQFGRAVKTVSGKVVGRDADSDCAFIRISKVDLGDVRPGLLPVDAAYTLEPGDQLWGASFPEGGALTVFPMEYIGMTSDGWIEARPSIKQGRSGGIVVDADGTRVIGITWGTREDRCYIVPARRFAKAVGRELASCRQPDGPLDFTQADKALFGVSLRPKKDGQQRPRRIDVLRQRGRRPIVVEPEQTAPLPNDPKVKPSADVSKAGVTVRIGDTEVQVGDDAPKAQPRPTTPPAPWEWKPLPPPHHHPAPHVVPPHRPAPPVHGPRFRGQSYYSTCPTCPNGQCPSTPAPTARPDLTPKKPLPIATPEPSTLPDPEPQQTRVREAIPAAPLPIATIDDPRLDSIPEIQQTLFGIKSAQEGIDRKVDDTLAKVGDLIESKKDSIKTELEGFRDDTLDQIDARIADANAQLEQRLQVLADTNEQIRGLRSGFDELYKDASRAAIISIAVLVAISMALLIFWRVAKKCSLI